MKIILIVVTLATFYFVYDLSIQQFNHYITKYKIAIKETTRLSEGLFNYDSNVMPDSKKWISIKRKAKEHINANPTILGYTIIAASEAVMKRNVLVNSGLYTSDKINIYHNESNLKMLQYLNARILEGNLPDWFSSIELLNLRLFKPTKTSSKEETILYRSIYSMMKNDNDLLLYTDILDFYFNAIDIIKKI